jgi:hypothetical protein
MVIEKKENAEVEVVLKTTISTGESEVKLTSGSFAENKRLISILIDDEISEYFSSEEEFLVELGNFASKVRFTGIVPENHHEDNLLSELKAATEPVSESVEDTAYDPIEESILDDGFLTMEAEEEEEENEEASAKKKKKKEKSKKDKKGKKDKKDKEKSKKNEDEFDGNKQCSEGDDLLSYNPTGKPSSHAAEDDNDFFKKMEEFENELTGGYEKRVDLPEPTLEYVKKLKEEEGSDALKEYLAKLTQSQKESLAALLAASKKK